MSVIDIAFIGSGAIHFGGAEGPWDHSKRLEQYPDIRFTAIVDPDIMKAQKVLEMKLRGHKRQLYENCRIYSSLDELMESQKPGAVFLGVPPAYHGSLDPGKDQELQLVSRGIQVFVEKPVSIECYDKFKNYVEAVEIERRKRNVVISVGYMFRYHAGVLKMRELISSHGGKVMAFNARYYMAYTELDHPFWWDMSKSGGPIVEQATHFCDLARYLVGEVDLTSVHTICLHDGDAGGAGRLDKVKENCESSIPVEKRIPRVTMSTWRFRDSGLGSLTHAVALHGEQYETSIDLIMDGLRMTLYEPYTTKCKLLVRTSGSDEETTYDFGSDDPYDKELKTFLSAVRDGDTTGIASSYTDAARTYQFTWAIRLAGEKNK